MCEEGEWVEHNWWIKMKTDSGSPGVREGYRPELSQIIQSCIGFNWKFGSNVSVLVEERAVGGKTETRLGLSRGQRGRRGRHETLPGGPRYCYSTVLQSIKCCCCVWNNPLLSYTKAATMLHKASCWARLLPISTAVLHMITSNWSPPGMTPNMATLKNCGFSCSKFCITDPNQKTSWAAHNIRHYIFKGEA